jgi:TPR repeat protein
MRRIGDFYADGRGVQIDRAMAMDWYEKAAVAGDLDSMRIVRKLYADEGGALQDLSKARFWAEKAATLGDRDAMIDLGVSYRGGRGGPRDLVKAREWYERAAAAGDDRAIWPLAQLAVAEAEEAGRYDEALRLQSARVTEAEAGEVRAAGKPGSRTANELGNLAWYALFAREPARALAAAERALAIDPSQLWIETNRVHAIMYLGRVIEARALFLLHKGKLVAGNDNKPWQQVIGEDFARLRKAGLEHPLMAEVEAALGIAR